MQLIVYHGSDRVIELPSYDGGRKFSDFGKGFYTTTNELDELDRKYYNNEAKEKRELMNKKMDFVRHKFGKIGKYFDELKWSDLSE